MDSLFTKNTVKLRIVTIAGLVVGALGIALLWAAGVAFPVYPPPGILLLLGGALFVGLVPRGWAPAIGVFLALFIIVGFLLSPTGVSNLVGAAGMVVAIGQAVQLVGVLIALITGSLAVKANYQKP